MTKRSEKQPFTNPHHGTLPGAARLRLPVTDRRQSQRRPR